MKILILLLLSATTFASALDTYRDILASCEGKARALNAKEPLKTKYYHECLLRSEIQVLSHLRDLFREKQNVHFNNARTGNHSKATREINAYYALNDRASEVSQIMGEAEDLRLEKKKLQDESLSPLLELRVQRASVRLFNYKQR